MPLPANSISIPTFAPRVGIIRAIFPGDEIDTDTNIVCEFPITFIVGQSVRIVIPPPTRATLTAPAFDYGMPELNGMIGTITFIDEEIPRVSFFIDIDTQFFQPFNDDAIDTATQYAQAVPVGELNSHLDGAWRNILRPV